MEQPIQTFTFKTIKRQVMIALIIPAVCFVIICCMIKPYSINYHHKQSLTEVWLIVGYVFYMLTVKVAGWFKAAQREYFVDVYNEKLVYRGLKTKVINFNELSYYRVVNGRGYTSLLLKLSDGTKQYIAEGIDGDTQPLINLFTKLIGNFNDRTGAMISEQQTGITDQIMLVIFGFGTLIALIMLIAIISRQFQ